MRYAVHEQGFIDGETYTTEIMQETLENYQAEQRKRAEELLGKEE